MSSIQADFGTIDDEMWVTIALTSPVPSTNPYFLDSWYQFGTIGTTWNLRKRVSGGTQTVVESGAGGGGSKTYKMELGSGTPAVQGSIDGTPVGSGDTYDLSSRDCYLLVHAQQDSSPTGTMTNFVAVHNSGTLSDDFTDNSTDTGVWGMFTTSGTASAAENNNVLEFTSSTNNQVPGYATKTTYNMVAGSGGGGGIGLSVFGQQGIFGGAVIR